MNHHSPPEVDDVAQLTVLLHWIGTVKDSLSLVHRGNLNVIGLYVQLNSQGDHWNLKAGGKFRTYFEADSPIATETSATISDPVSTPWNIQKYDRPTWLKRFAKLVWPTTDLAAGIMWAIRLESESGFELIDKRISEYEKTGLWIPITTSSCSSCSSSLELWDQWAEFCYHCDTPLKSGPFNREPAK